jgi:hypothetical protein
MAVAADYADSFLTRALADIRKHIDEPTVIAKYTDAELIRQLELSYILVLGEKNRNALTPAVASIDVTLASGTYHYILPYTVGSIEAIYEGDAGGTRLFYSKRGGYNPMGKLVWVEGNVLRVQATSFLSLGTTLTVEYIPSGIARLHHGACTLNAAGTVATLGASPNVGTLDTHHHAYMGSTFRFLNVIGTTVTNNYQQERTISGYVNSTRAATLKPALSDIPTTDNGEILYEIAPAIWKGLDAVVALHAAKSIAMIEGLGRAANIQKTYQEAIRHVRLSAYYSNVQDCTTMGSDGFDNRYY